MVENVFNHVKRKIIALNMNGISILAVSQVKEDLKTKS